MADSQSTLLGIRRRFEHDVTSSCEVVQRTAIGFAKGRAYLRVLVDEGADVEELPARYGGLDVIVESAP